MGRLAGGEIEKLDAKISVEPLTVPPREAPSAGVPTPARGFTASVAGSGLLSLGGAAEPDPVGAC